MSEGDFPFVTVVLPVRNEERHIEKCLGRLLDQDYPAERFEVLVVDGESTDDTRSIVERVMARCPAGRLRLLRNPKRIVPAALNAGIEAARGEIVVRMDGHTVPERSYLSSCVQALQEFGAANVGGPMVPQSDGPFGRAVAAAQQHPIGVGDARFHFDGHSAPVDTVYMGAFRRDIFSRAGLFDESMVRNQDYEMNVRIRKAGGTIYLDPRIRSVYTPRGSLPSLWRQYLQYGWWRVETTRRHPDSLRWRQLVAPAFVLTLALLALAAPLAPVARLGLGALAATYLLVLFGSALSLRGRLAYPSWLLFPAAVATMHLAWGLGFLLNLLSLGRFPYSAASPSVPRPGSAREATASSG